MPENQRHTPTWGTWEELLLACAVKRHGFNNWDSVAMEVQSRTSLPPLLVSSLICQQKYHDLHRRFTPDENLPPHPPSDDHHHHHHHQEEYLPSNNNRLPLLNNSSSGDKVVNIPWLEELRQLRVAELKQEVHRYDVSILSLQLKVKKLEEERENSLQDNHHKDQGREGPDLDRRISEFHQPDMPSQSQPQKLSPEESDRSVNESNSTCSERKPGEGTQGLLVRLETEARTVLSGSNLKQVAGEESYEVGDSVTQLSSEVQSSASLGRKRKGRSGKEVAGGDDHDGIKRVSAKSEPLVGFLDMIRAHQHASLFECRLQSQETDEYKNLVKQHLDLETIQTKLEQCSYNTSSNLSFYRDLLLLFNNAVVFFPNSSIESQTAHQLRSFVSNEMRKETQKSDSAPASLSLPAEPKNELQRSDSLLARQKSSAPIIVCRKRSSLSAKPSSSSSGPKIEQQQRSNDSKPANDLKQPVVEPDLVEAKSKEKPVTGVRSSRRNIKNLKKGTSSTPNKKQNESPGTKVGAIDKAQTPKNDKKKTEASAALEKKKSAADFLKRIKKNSPVEASKKNNSRGGGGEKKTENSSRKGQKGKERVGRRNGETKQVKEESNPSTTKKSTGRQLKKGSEGSRGSRKRGREGGGGGGTDQAATRPRKRSKR